MDNRSSESVSDSTARKKIAIYMTSDDGPDEAILRGLRSAGCEVTQTHTVPETVEVMRSLPEGALPLLVAEVQAGAMPLLALLRERSAEMPPTLLLDRVGDDIYAPIKALEFGVRSYVLSSQPSIEREITAQLAAERAMVDTRPAARDAASAAGAASSSAAGGALTQDIGEGFDWDAVSHVIRVAGRYIHLSPIEGRIFDLLLKNQGRTVTLQDFMQNALRNPNISEKTALEQLRPHMMRLRRKLAVHPPLASRIVNTRGSGYMMM